MPPDQSSNAGCCLTTDVQEPPGAPGNLPGKPQGTPGEPKIAQESSGELVVPDCVTIFSLLATYKPPLHTGSVLVQPLSSHRRTGSVLVWPVDHLQATAARRLRACAASQLHRRTGSVLVWPVSLTIRPTAFLRRRCSRRSTRPM